MEKMSRYSAAGTDVNAMTTIKKPKVACSPTIGVVSAFVPALGASRISIVEALRAND